MWPFSSQTATPQGFCARDPLQSRCRAFPGAASLCAGRVAAPVSAARFAIRRPCYIWPRRLSDCGRCAAGNGARRVALAFSQTHGELRRAARRARDGATYARSLAGFRLWRARRRVAHPDANVAEDLREVEPPPGAGELVGVRRVQVPLHGRDLGVADAVRRPDALAAVEAVEQVAHGSAPDGSPASELGVARRERAPVGVLALEPVDLAA